MAPVLRQGWELDDSNNSSKIFKAKTYQAVPAIPGGQELVEIVNNTSTGNFDIYETRLIGPRPDKPIFSYNASDNKITIVSQNAYNKYYTGASGKKQFEALLKSSKEATFDLAQINTGTDTVSNADFERLKTRPGYQSLANKAQGGQRAVPPGGAGGTTTPSPSQTPTPAAGTIKPEDFESLDKITDDKLAVARNSYASEAKPLKYPENLQLEHQDCIKFRIFKYEPRGLSLVENRERRRLNKKTPIGTIVLPVPAGISDSNTADWQKDDLDLATAGISDFITQFVSKGKDAGVASAKETLGALSDTDSKTLASIVAVKTAQAVTNTNVLSRAYGQVLNPNSELLFTGPSLRSFSFSFRLSPRSATEAKIVRSIIRHFKQAMSVQRSQSILLLRAPNTFGIEYLTSGQNAHPYLNKFKECALTQCNVNYTPDGQYMTYAGEPSMTSYELQLQFQELEPIFNDDYTELDKDQDLNIGY
jgi:hypothetical protein